MIKNLLAKETKFLSVGWEDSLDEGMATHSSLLTWRIPWTEEPGGLQFNRVAKSRTRLTQLSTHTHILVDLKKVVLTLETLLAN